MSRKDIFHDLVKQALTHDGWIISDDPLYLSIGNLNIQIDLGAEYLTTAKLLQLLDRHFHIDQFVVWLELIFPVLVAG